MEEYLRAGDLPEKWDAFIDDNVFLKRNFLDLMENLNPCNQRYYIFRNRAGEIDSLIVTYDYQNNLLTFLTDKIQLYANIKFIYLPVSVSEPGIIVGQDTKQEVEAFLNGLKGLKVALNVDEGTELENFAKGITLPTCKMQINWATFDEYLAQMRSNYRYRLNKALKRGRNLQVAMLPDNAEFSQEMYSLYEQVIDRADHKIEKLPISFFQAAGPKIFKFALGNQLVAFIQLLENKEELIFMFGGFDYSLNLQYDLYFNMLLKIVDYAIENNFKAVDFGQTAEDSKLKLGCQQESKYLLVHHSNKIFNWLLHKMVNILSYKLNTPSFRVFKEGEGGIYEYFTNSPKTA